MQKKLLALLFVTAVLASSFAASVLPLANALTQRTEFNDQHRTATNGGTNVCGDHVCANGEKTQWLEKMSQLQRSTGPGKVVNAYTYLSGISLTSNATTGPASNTTPMSNSTSMHGALNMTEKMAVGENMTSTGNGTKGTK
jgi:hypothetical protein